MSMEALAFLLVLTQSLAISLGVGASTVAVINFFAALRDGLIDETERNMMGIVYWILRVAMVLIVITSIPLLMLGWAEVQVLPGYVFAFVLTISVLYLNAIGMTYHRVPSTFGPAIQAASWYTLGVLSTLATLSMQTFLWWQFLLAYITAITCMIAVVNGVMAYLKDRHGWAEPTNTY